MTKNQQETKKLGAFSSSNRSKRSFKDMAHAIILSSSLPPFILEAINVILQAINDFKKFNEMYLFLFRLKLLLALILVFLAFFHTYTRSVLFIFGFDLCYEVLPKYFSLPTLVSKIW